MASPDEKYIENMYLGALTVAAAQVGCAVWSQPLEARRVAEKPRKAARGRVYMEDVAAAAGSNASAMQSISVRTRRGCTALAGYTMRRSMSPAE